MFFNFFLGKLAFLFEKEMRAFQGVCNDSFFFLFNGSYKVKKSCISIFDFE